MYETEGFFWYYFSSAQHHYKLRLLYVFMILPIVVSLKKKCFS